MAVRIYVLARDLNLDSKELIEYCKLAGIEGKSSALASLTDEETDRVKAMIQGGAKRPTATATQVRPPAAPLKRTDYVPASGASGKIPTIGPAPKPAEPERKGQRKREMPRPRVAAPPSMRAPAPPSPKAEEPAPQKPDLRLPPDAIRARKPLEEHIRRHEEKRRAEQEGPTVSQPRAPTDQARPGPLVGREERKRRRGNRALERRQRQQERLQLNVDEEDRAPAQLRRRTRLTRTRGAVAAPPKTKAQIEGALTVRAVSEAFGVPSSRLLGHMIKSDLAGLTININSTLDEETVQLLAMDFGLEVTIKRPPDLAEEVKAGAEVEDLPESLQLRPPVATLLGHVDHGKTSLLDAIRKTNVVAGEAGGITQHIGAYQIEHDGQEITFLDTPGHEAFTAMRARGANVTDIAILVVAADDGVMPQTEEAISHARAAGVPIVVALNKSDLPTANDQRVLQQLASADLLPQEWGGDVEVIRTSAVSGDGVDQLLTTLLTLAELNELKANPDAPASGVCLESSSSKDRGILATFLVQRGTLRVGDVVWCGDAEGKIRTMEDDRGRQMEQAGPSTPVLVTGLAHAPSDSGEHFYVVEDRGQARNLAEGQVERRRTQDLDRQPHMTLETFAERRQQEQVQELNLVVKADTRGSVEAIRQELDKLVHPEVRVKVLHQGVGAVNESDVRLGDASDAVVLAFHVGVEERAQALGDHEHVQVRSYEVIYELVSDVRDALEGLIAPEQREVETGRAVVLQTFRISRLGTVAGCRVTGGTIERNNRVRVMRDGEALGNYPIASLRREKDDVRDVREGYECGIRLSGFDDVHEGDELVGYRIEEVKRTL